MSLYLDPVADKPRLNRVRGLARRYGMRVEKGRGAEHINNLGGLQLVAGNRVLAGVDYDLTLEMAEYWIGYYRDQLPA